MVSSKKNDHLRDQEKSQPPTLPNFLKNAMLLKHVLCIAAFTAVPTDSLYKELHELFHSSNYKLEDPLMAKVDFNYQQHNLFNVFKTY